MRHSIRNRINVTFRSTPGCRLPDIKYSGVLTEANTGRAWKLLWHGVCGPLSLLQRGHDGETRRRFGCGAGEPSPSEAQSSSFLMPNIVEKNEKKPRNTCLSLFAQCQPRGGACRRNMGLQNSSNAIFRFHALGPRIRWGHETRQIFGIPSCTKLKVQDLKFYQGVGP